MLFPISTGEDQPITSYRTGTNDYKVISATIQDSGTYLCEAYNGGGRDQSTVTVTG